jgi:hypothetical protein
VTYPASKRKRLPTFWAASMGFPGPEPRSMK